METIVPPPPEGFELDSPESSALPTPPPGFELDLQPESVRRPRSTFATTSQQPEPMEISPSPLLEPSESISRALQPARSPIETRREALTDERTQQLREKQEGSLANFLTRIGLSVGQAGGTLRKMEGGLLGALPLQFLDPILKPLTGETKQEASRRLRNQGREIEEYYRKLGADMAGGTLSEIAQEFGTTAQVSAATIPAAMYGGLSAAATVAGLQSTGATYDEAVEAYKRQGFKQDEAERRATLPAYLSGTITSAVTAGFGRTGIEALAKPDFTRKSLTALVNESFKQAGMEGMEEIADQIGQSILSKSTYNPDMTLGDAVEQSIFAGIAGFGLGGAAVGAIKGPGAAVEGARRSRRLSLARAERMRPERADALAERRADLEAQDITDTIMRAGQAQGGTDAGSIASTTEMGVRGEGGEVGAQTPLRQPGQAAPPQAAQTPTVAPAPLNPGGAREDLPPDLAAQEAENQAAQRKIAEDFKAEMARKKAAAVPPVEPAKKVIEPNFLTPDGIPVWETELDPKSVRVYPNFKKYADTETGVVPGKELKGPYDRLGKPPIVVWEKADGSRWVVTGRHKLDLAKREGLKGIPTQLVRETDGWTENMAKIKDVEQNIQDNQGSIYDYARYFREFKALNYEDALKRGLLRESKGRDAFRIGRNASQQTFEQWYSSDGRDLTDEQALAIANAAPGNEAAQKLGRKYAAEGRTPESVGNQVRRAAQEKPTLLEGELFGDTAFQDIEAEEDAAAMLRREIRQNINAIRGAGKSPELARKWGVDVNDPGSVNRKVAELSEQLEQLEGDWWLKSNLAKMVRDRAGTERAAIKPEKPAAAPAPKTPQEIAEAASNERLAKLDAEIDDIINQLGKRMGTGPDPALVAQLISKGAQRVLEYAARGVRTFPDLVRRLKADKPQWWPIIKDYIYGIYHAARGANRELAPITEEAAQRVIDDLSGVAAPAPAKTDPAAMVAELDQWFARKAKGGKVSYQAKNDKNWKYPAWLAQHLSDNGISRWQDMTYPVLESFRDKILTPKSGQKLEPGTANSYLKATQRWVKYLESKYPELAGRVPRLSESDIFEPVVGRTKQAKASYLNNDALEKLLTPKKNGTPVDLRMEAAMEIEAATGLRPIEMARLRVGQIDLENGRLNDVELSEKQRGAGNMTYILPEVALDRIQRYLKSGRPKMDGASESDYLFPISGGDHWKGKSFSDNVADRAREMGVSDVSGQRVSAYTFRYTLQQQAQDVLQMTDRDINMLVWHAEGQGMSAKYRTRNSPEWLNQHGARVRELPHNQEFLKQQKGGVPREEAKKEAPVLNPADEATMGSLRLGVSKAQWVEMAKYNDAEQTAKWGTTRARIIEQATLAAKNPPAQPPTLRPGEKGTGDLLQGADAPFNLAGESGTDAGRIAREQAAAEESARAAAEFERKNQLGFPGMEPPREGQPKRLFLDTNTGNVSFRRAGSRVARELRLDSPGDVLAALDSPSLPLQPRTRAVLRALVTSNMAQRSPGFSVAITDFISGGLTGEHLPGKRLFRFVHWADAQTPVHEFLHHVFHYLQPEDRDFIRSLRYKVIGQELGKARNYAELGPLEKMLNKRYSSDEFIEEGFPTELYHLANESEFFVWMMQEKALQSLTQPEEVGFIANLRALFARWFQDFKRLFGMTPREQDLWQQIVDGKYEYRVEDGQRFSEEREGSLPPEEPGDVVEEQENAKIKYAASEIPRLVKSNLDVRKEAIARLETDEFNTKQYRDARNKIDELVTAAVRVAQNSGDTYWDQPDALPTATDPELAQKLQLLGIEFNSDALVGMQKEIAFENKAKNLFRMRRRLAEVRRDMATLAQVGVVGDAILSATEERLIRAIFRAETDPDVDNAQGMTVNERSQQIQSAFDERIENKALADSLNLPFVRETFVDPMASGDQMFARFGRTLQAFKASMDDPAMPLHYKAAIANEFLKQLYRFSDNKRQFTSFYDSQRQSVAQSLRQLQEKYSSAQINYGLAEILAQDTLATAKGEKGLLGSWTNREAAEYLLQSYETVITFAKNLRAAYPNGGAQAVLSRLLSVEAVPTLNRLLGEIRAGTNPDLELLKAAQIAPEALARIIYVLNTSDEFADAVGAIVRYGEAKLSADPGRRLERIATLLESKNPIERAEAEDRINQLAAEARRGQSAAEASMKYLSRELQRAQIALKALDYGKELFDGVTGTPEAPNAEYFDIKRRAEEYLNVEEAMILSTGKDPSQYGATTTTFRPFKAGDIDQPELTVNAGAPVYLNEQIFNRIKDWFDKASQYVVSFEAAESEWRSDPASKSPEELGYDRTVYNGLKRAMEKYSTYQDPVIRFFGTKTDNSFLEQWMMQTRFFRQYLGAMRQTNGQTARQLQTAIVNYGNLMGETKAASHRHRSDIKDALHGALNSHPELQGDIEQYKTQVFNELASEGRKFGSPLKVGFALPVFGKVVTAQDMKLLRELRSYYDDLRSNVSERQGRGIIEERGSRQVGNYRVLVRKAASVGDLGLPMHVSRPGDILIRDIQQEYDDAKKADALPTPGADLSQSSSNPIVQFWNRNATSLTRHILDAGREYRALTQDRYMIDAERAAAAELIANNNPLAIQSVEDAVALIAKHFPDNTGLDVRSYVAESLFEELSQYYRNAGIYAGKMAELQKTEGVGGMSLTSEFTQGAAQFLFPSNWYDYGAVTDTDILHLTARVLHEPIMEVSKAMERMSAALQSEIDESLKTKQNKTNYTSLREADRVKRLIEKLLGDFRLSWNLSSPDVNRSGWEFPPDLIKASLLANVPVQMRNVVLGGAMSHMRMAALHRLSQGVAMLNNFRHVAGIVSRLPVDVLFSPDWPVGRQMQSLLRGPLRSLIPPLADWIADNIVDAHVRDVREVQNLGFSLRDPFLKQVSQLWRDINTFQSTKAAMEAGPTTKFFRGAKNVARTLTAAYRLVGSEYADKLINSQALAFAGSIEQTLRGVAEVYGRAREGLGKFDPADKRWLVTPNEFSHRLTYAGRQKNLSQFINMLQGADISLEKTLYDYYQKSKDGSEAPAMFNDEQLSALRRAVLREFNAGDVLNRPTGASTSKLFRLLTTFQGYTSDFLLKFVGQFNGSRDQSVAKQMAMALPTLFGYAVGATILALFSQEMTDWYRRKFQGATKRQVTLLTKEFWTNWDNAKDALITGSFSTVPILGDLVLFTRGVVVNNRGYEPTGRILAFGLMNQAFATVRGMWNLRNDGANVLNPLRDFILQYAGFSKEIATAVGTDYSQSAKLRGAEAAMRYKAEQLGLNQEREAGNVKPGQYYSATSGIREDMRVAMMKQDPEALQDTFKKLVDFYAEKGVATPETSAARDVRMLNPILRAFGNKKPTADEFNQVHSGLTSDQKEAVAKAVNAWEWAAGQLGINFNPINPGRSSGASASGPAISYAGRAPRISGSPSPSFASARGRRLSLRSYQTRGTSRRLRSRRIRLRSARSSLRTPRRRTLRLRRARISLS